MYLACILGCIFVVFSWILSGLLTDATIIIAVAAPDTSTSGSLQEQI